MSRKRRNFSPEFKARVAMEALSSEQTLSELSSKYGVHRSDSKHSLPVAPNRLDRRFEAKRPNQAWLADITYIPTREGWLYLAAVLDMHSRRIVGWAMDKRMNRQLVIDALLMAIWQRKPAKGLLHHSDRGKPILQQ